MSLVDFLGGSQATDSWADDDMALPTAPMATAPVGRTGLANAMDRKDLIASRRGEALGPVEYPTEPPFTAY
ncbi:hypothetical protein LPJ70_006578, partial [Coemansia sp. RSA 2708]